MPGGVNSVFHEERTILENVGGGRAFLLRRKEKKNGVSLEERM